MKKVIGYAVSIVGLFVLVVAVGFFKLNIAFIENMNSTYVMVFGMVLVLIGVFLTMMDGKAGRGKNHAEELPIYEGTGKKRRVVGYRRG
jgi:multisubunit Na+/H+ antiporter MnhG subunit